MTALEAALQYAGCGCSVLPCRDKVPLVRGGVHAATHDLATIERWWHTWPQANVAVACGAASGIVVIDIDAPSQVPELFNLTTLCASTPNLVFSNAAIVVALTRLAKAIFEGGRGARGGGWGAVI